jgi:hypothetical protein
MWVFGVILMLLDWMGCEGYLREETTLQKGEYTLIHGRETGQEHVMKKCPCCGSIIYDKHVKPKPIHMAPIDDNGSWAWIAVVVIGAIFTVAMAIILFFCQ